MRAMILAAGRGTRLRPFTDSHPKALAQVGGVPLLEIVLRRLIDAGVREVVINLHHLGEQIEAFMRVNSNFGLSVRYSPETELLDTGGGLKQAARWLEDAPGGSFLVHNVDVLSDIDLRAMMHQHRTCGALATLAAMPRDTKRHLLFDTDGQLCGRVTADGENFVRPASGQSIRLGFAGIHAVSCRLLPLISEIGVFPIMESYLRLASEGERIRVFRADSYRWRDAGRPTDLRPLD